LGSVAVPGAGSALLDRPPGGGVGHGVGEGGVEDRLAGTQEAARTFFAATVASAAITMRRSSFFMRSSVAASPQGSVPPPRRSPKVAAEPHYAVPAGGHATAI
jgi:hypothetical protein